MDKTVKIGAVNNIFSAVNPTGLISYIGNTLARPIPIPPFDFYVTIARAVSNAVSPAFVNRLDTVSLGRAYGNILEFGALHFAPYPSILVCSTYKNDFAIFNRIWIFHLRLTVTYRTC